MTTMDKKLETQAAELFQKGNYAEAAATYSSQLDSLPEDAAAELRVNLLFNRGACYIKTKEYEKALEDSNAVLALDSKNVKSLMRKIKVLRRMAKFVEAHQVAHQWVQIEPQSAQAKKELEKLDVVINVLQDQEVDEDVLEENIISGERVPPEGREDDGSTQSPSNLVTTAVSSSAASPTSTIKASSTPSSTTTSTPASTPTHSDSTNTTDTERPQSPAVSEASSVEQGAIGGDTFPCSYCDISFQSSTELQTHCRSDLHRKKVSSDEGREWHYRAPPRGLTSDEYSLCPRFFGDGTCRFGPKCSQAHSDAELVEWKERFEYKKQRVWQAKENNLQGNTFAEQLLQKWMNAENPETVMIDSLEGVHVHINADLAITMSSKRCSSAWTFTVTSKQLSVRRVALLDDSHRRHFHLTSITVGPKKTQKVQKIEEQCQEWTNSSFTPACSSTEKVYRIKVMFRTDIYGTFRQTVVFDFGSEPVLVRQLCVDSTPVSDVEKLAQDLKMKECGRWDLTSMTVIEFSPKPVAMEEEEKALLKQYPPPMAAKFAISDCLQKPELTKESYKRRMHDLLFIEEMAQFLSIAQYNVRTSMQLVNRFLLMPSTVSTAKFAQNGELFARMKLNADISEDTAHGRLILQNVNTVYVARDNPAAPDPLKVEQVYEALVEEKGKNFIFLRISAKCVKELNLSTDTDFHAQVQFHLNRLPLCEMHQAIDKLPSLEYVFPDISVSSSIPWNPLRQWGDKLDKQMNAKQKEAIVALTTSLEHHLPPLLLVGPYGTGKTFTLAQAVKQILQQPNTRVLVCTHSNSAADLYIKDYLHPFCEDGHTEARPLRIYYRHRWVQTVHPTVLQYCMIGPGTISGPMFNRPKKEDVEKHRVIVATLSTSRYLYNLDLEDGFFTHILLDEAAQACECEAIMPLALANSKTRIVLAGDHMQLSPEVHSDFARERNLNISLLERLYDLYPVNNPCKVLLCENYRSHKAIIDFTSELFYDNQLMASGNQPRHEVFYPLTFFTARGEDLQHQNSTAFYNNAEVYEIVERVSELQKMWPKTWGPQDDGSIGVVAPYADQVVRIRSELRKRKLYNINVERVLNVQGKQFRAIFLSTVRTRHTCSSDNAVEDLMDYGFLSNVKLLNTAITRAQSLVAVVGDPVSLCSIGKCRKLWERFLEICHRQNSLYGITWNHLRAQLDGVELKKTYILNPLAPEFIPNRLRHAPYAPPEPVSLGKYGYSFVPGHPVPPRPPHMIHPGVPQMYYQPVIPMPHMAGHFTSLPPPPQAWSRAHGYSLQKAPISGSHSRTAAKPASQESAKSPKEQERSAAASKSQSSGSVAGSNQSYTVVSVSRPPGGEGKSPESASVPTPTVPSAAQSGTPTAKFVQGQGVQYQNPKLASPAFQPGLCRIPSFPAPFFPPQGYFSPVPHPYIMPPPPRLATTPPLFGSPPHHPVFGAAVGPRVNALGPSHFQGFPISQPLSPNFSTSPGSSIQSLGQGSPVSSSVGSSTLSPLTLTDKPGSIATSSALSPSGSSDRSTPQFQILPTARNIPPSSQPGGLPNGAAHTAFPVVQRSGLGLLNKKLNPDLPDEQVLFSNPFLQREFYNYILQTEGLEAASHFMEYIQQPRKWFTNGIQMAVPMNSPNRSMGSTMMSTSPTKGKKRESVTVSVKLDEPPRGHSYESSTSLSALGTDLSDISDHSSRSSVQSERSADNISPQALGVSPEYSQGRLASWQRSSGSSHLQVDHHGRYDHHSVQQRSSPKIQNGSFHTSSDRPCYSSLVAAGRSLAPNQNYRRVPMQSNYSNGEQQARPGQGDMLEDPELPAAVDHMVKFIEESLEDKSSEMELGNIHIGHTPMKMPELGRQGPPERQVPLYMRRAGQGSQTQPNLSYAGALRSQPPPIQPQPDSNRPSPPIPVPNHHRLDALHMGDLNQVVPLDGVDPLDLLKNLNIRASPGTQALYQYFS